MRGLRWFGGIAVTALYFIFAEGWIIGMVKVLGYGWSTVVVTLVTVILSWTVIYFSSEARSVGTFRDWLKSKEERLSHRAQVAVKGGKILAVVNTTFFLGAIFASILMIMIGIERKKVYFYSFWCSLFRSIVWCGVYSGMFRGIDWIVAGKI